MVSRARNIVHSHTPPNLVASLPNFLLGWGGLFAYLPCTNDDNILNLTLNIHACLNLKGIDLKGIELHVRTNICDTNVQRILCLDKRLPG